MNVMKLPLKDCDGKIIYIVAKHVVSVTPDGDAACNVVTVDCADGEWWSIALPAQSVVHLIRGGEA